MSARIAPDSIGAVAAMAVDYRPPAAPPVQNREVAAASSSSSAGPNASSAAPRRDPTTPAGSETGPAREKAAPAPPPPPLPPEQPGADYVRAVISGQLLPRPTSAQELFARVGTGWVPPESEYRLTEKIA